MSLENRFERFENLGHSLDELRWSASFALTCLDGLLNVIQWNLLGGIACTFLSLPKPAFGYVN